MGSGSGVVVVGAGPVGLTAALAVRGRGVPVTVLEADATDRPRPGSRAIYYHRQTLAHWDALTGGLGHVADKAEVLALNAQLLSEAEGDGAGAHAVIAKELEELGRSMREMTDKVGGIVSDDPMPILGQAAYQGPVLIVWDEALNEARHPGTGHNVVFHEFAHKIDMLDGTIDGTPPLATRDELERWVEVCTRVYGQVSSGNGGRTLRAYAGVNPAEFFAVATEAFFDDPRGLHDEHGDLYDVLREFYRQDPLTWSAAA
jgi:voltage-gated potassium channel Kch